MSIPDVSFCDDCNRSTAGRCPQHYSFNVIGAMMELSHLHDWKVAGQLADGQVLLVCNHHDPPWTRLVQP